MTSLSSQNKEPKLEGRGRNILIAFNIALSIVTTGLLVLAMTNGRYYRPASGDPASLTGLKSEELPPLILFTLLTMVVAGATGGTLCNLRGLFIRIGNKQEPGFPERLEAPFYIRPFTGALTGLVSFIVAGFFAASLTLEAPSLSWVTLPGRLPFVAIAILAGFAAQEFMQKLKEVAKDIFSHRPEEDDTQGKSDEE